MTGVSNKPKIPFKGIISYLFGAFFLLMSLGSFVSHGFIAGLLFFVAAIVTIPQTLNQLEQKINASVNGTAKFCVVFLLVAMAFAAFPATPAATNDTSNNTEMIAASPSSVKESEAIAVPAQQTPVTISNSTSNPANTSDAEPAPKAVSTPASTTTQTLDNKGKLDILTNPAGATVTVDGVSEGMSPIEGLSVDAGTHSVTVYLSGYDSQQEKVEVENSETKELFYTLVPTAKPSSTSTSTQKGEENNQEHVKTETRKVEASSTNYQDAQWLAAMSRNAPIIGNDMTSVSAAASSSDYVSLSNSGSALYYDSLAAIDDSNMYDVSPALQPTKDEFEKAIYDSRDAGSNIVSGVYELNQGRTDESIKYLNLAAENTDECTRHTETATRLLDEYNSKL